MKLSKRDIEHESDSMLDYLVAHIVAKHGLLTEAQWETIFIDLQPEIEDLLEGYTFPEHIPSKEEK
jgi:hypothetical protein